MGMVGHLARDFLSVKELSPRTVSNLSRELSYSGVTLTETEGGWSLYHSGSSATVTMSLDGNFYTPDGSKLTSVRSRGYIDQLMDYFESYLPQSTPEETLQYIRGNLLTSDCDVIAHGCNCYNAMTGGIARAIAHMYPGAERADSATERADESQLGSFTYTRGNPSVFNLYTQYEPGANIDYDAVRGAFKAFYHHLKSHNMLDLKIGIPKIGAGIAGGDWGRISKIIESIWQEGQIYVYVM